MNKPLWLRFAETKLENLGRGATYELFGIVYQIGQGRSEVGQLADFGVLDPSGNKSIEAGVDHVAKLYRQGATENLKLVHDVLDKALDQGGFEPRVEILASMHILLAEAGEDVSALVREGVRGMSSSKEILETIAVACNQLGVPQLIEKYESLQKRSPNEVLAYALRDVVFELNNVAHKNSASHMERSALLTNQILMLPAC